jgi:hypothetical protein
VSKQRGESSTSHRFQGKPCMIMPRTLVLSMRQSFPAQQSRGCCGGTSFAIAAVVIRRCEWQAGDMTAVMARQQSSATSRSSKAASRRDSLQLSHKRYFHAYAAIALILLFDRSRKLQHGCAYERSSHTSTLLRTRRMGVYVGDIAHPLAHLSPVRLENEDGMVPSSPMRMIWISLCGQGKAVVSPNKGCAAATRQCQGGHEIRTTQSCAVSMCTKVPATARCSCRRDR